jgi:hypothetical protein
VPKFAADLVKLSKKWQGKVDVMCDNIGDTTLRQALNAAVREPVKTAANHLVCLGLFFPFLAPSVGSV